MATVQDGITELQLIKELPEKTSLSATDLLLVQTSVSSFKVTDETLVSSLPDNTTITVNGSNKLTVSSSVLEGAYPVGSIYMNATNSTNPASLLGFGTWVALGAGRVLMGAGSGTDVNGDSQSFSAGATGGEYSHELTVAELPSHRHNNGVGELTTVANDIFIYGTTTQDAPGLASQQPSTGGGTPDIQGLTSYTGSNQPHNNIQPYITVYMWQRTA